MEFFLHGRGAAGGFAQAQYEEESECTEERSGADDEDFLILRLGEEQCVHDVVLEGEGRDVPTSHSCWLRIHFHSVF